MEKIKIKKCRICGKEFEIKKGSNGSRQFCYECTPFGVEWAERTKFKRQAMKREALRLLGGSCLKCGETRQHLIDFHHLDSNDKEGTLSKLMSDSKVEDYFKELEKTIPLCGNCHRDFHFLESENQIKIEEFVDLETFNFYKNTENRSYTYLEKIPLVKSNKKAPLTIQPEDDIIQDYDALIEEIKETSFEAVGRKYGISSNAIKKRLKARGYPHLASEIKPISKKEPKPKNWRELPISLIKENKNFNFDTGNEAIDFITAHSDTQRNRVSEGLSRVVNKKRKSYLGYTVQED